ncbi:NAD(P)-dependent dehydrogenase (short-subunit alcohol dehydrogenase family) [Larkinella arboricola]|uniref:NAD(P)-dependent dehydrogenase (Short-subunit alcohol dehydrogenase family) n=1 Tax=Larkinella arboricola TaxID=643671 RepID=A0A327WM81_LARAB|nr:SDR family oxidoreductase [Larkinella arboricola]RAJ93123.1 NAD(P)-dependent dehydrogenase (short-subunit alcohol dehydrogenase family) [Larkinella arboricola]
MNSLFSLTGKVAIVTGGAGFFGTPISLALAEAGAQVVIASRDGEKCRKFAETLQEKGLLAEGMALDLEEETSIRQFVQAVKEQFGRIDVLVNNAVSRDGFQNLEDIDKASWEKAQRINSTGLVLITQAVVEVMKPQRSGSIINISSIQGAVGPNFPVYGNTGMTSPVNYTYDKWGMVGFTKWLANYYGKDNIRANCISPGGYGPGVAQMSGKDEFIENYKRLTPLGRFADDDDIKGPVVFMASDASAFVTGQNLLVDGGWTSW